MIRFAENPSFVRRIRTLMRGRRPFMILSFCGLILSLVVFFSMMVSYGSTRLGHKSFYPASVALLFLVSFFSLTQTSRTVFDERERLTFDLLSVTAMTPWQIVVGEACAALAYVLLIIASALPMMALCVYMGGVSLMEIFAVALYIFSVGILLTGVGLLYSTIRRRRGWLGVAAMGLAGLILVMGSVNLIGSMMWGRGAVGNVVGVTVPFFGRELPLLVLALTLSVLGGLLFLSIAGRKFRVRDTQPVVPWQVVGITVLLLLLLVGFTWKTSMGWRSLYSYGWICCGYLFLAVIWTAGFRNPFPRIPKRDPILRVRADSHWHLLLLWGLMSGVGIWWFHLSGNFTGNLSVEELGEVLVMIGAPAVGGFGLERYLSVRCRQRRWVVGGLLIFFVVFFAVLTIYGEIVSAVHYRELRPTALGAEARGGIPLSLMVYMIFGRFSPFCAMGRVTNPASPNFAMWPWHVWVHYLAFHLALGMALYIAYRVRVRRKGTEDREKGRAG